MDESSSFEIFTAAKPEHNSPSGRKGKPVTRDDERVLQLIRLERWLARRSKIRLWIEAAAVSLALACLLDTLALLAESPDPYCVESIEHYVERYGR